MEDKLVEYAIKKIKELENKIKDLEDKIDYILKINRRK